MSAPIHAGLVLVTFILYMPVHPASESGELCGTNLMIEEEQGGEVSNNPCNSI